MIDWIVFASYSVSGAMLLMMAIGIVFSAFMPALDRWSRGYFIILFSLLLLYSGVIFVDVVIYSTPGLEEAQKPVYLFESLFFSLLMPMPVPFHLHCCGESQKGSRLLRSVMILWGVFLIMLVVSQFTDIFYYTEDGHHYLRGACFPLMLFPLSVIIFLNIIGLLRKRKKLSKKVFGVLLVYQLPTLLLIIVYMFLPIDTFVSFWIGFCALTMFALILMDNVEQYMRQQREIACQRSDVMVLQMRPHFIYNTMMGIYYLCDQDPEKAKQVTLDFTIYLRKNFTAIASQNTVPFKDELEHTRAYLAVEQAQFEDSLFVVFDTPHTMFRVPPLTLQPIVENAVKHGMISSSDPIHISVITRQTDSGSEIIVEDDGPGFDPVKDNQEHIALNNIRERLALMCKGELIISSREGGGTSVKVTIPVPDN